MDETRGIEHTPTIRGHATANDRHGSGLGTRHRPLHVTVGEDDHTQTDEARVHSLEQDRRAADGWREQMGDEDDR